MRLDGVRASMRMSEPFPKVWLPSSISIGFRMTLALGEVAATYEVTYHDYRLPTATVRVR